ncbi:MAG TPA: universal stress protein, partial [Thermoanaerobaculia bacterium]|nr:universal stress protein [Thermoanaerobaculia bacterium]
PEDVQLGGAASAGAAQLGLARVEEATFAGSFERLRLRLPTPPGVRGVAPPAPFGSAFVWLDAIRPQPEARRLPLRSGDEVAVAVRRVHVLASAALRLLVLGRDNGEGEEPGPAGRFAAALAERTAATISKAGAAPPPDGWDLALFDLPEAGAALPGPEVDHLLFVNPGAALPRRILVCIAVGEPGKEDVSFAERLAWRLAAQVTVLTVLPGPSQEPPPHVRRFLDAAARALGRRGVEVTTQVRHGAPRREILAEIAEGQHDLLVMGAPVPPRGHPFAIFGLVERLLADRPCPVLVVRSLHPAAMPAAPLELARSAR